MLKLPNITPGPWRPGRRYVYADDGDFQVCELPGEGAVFSGDEDANARAIAAVPALLEALKEALEPLAYMAAQHPLNAEHTEYCGDKAEKARAALLLAGATEEAHDVSPAHPKATVREPGATEEP